MKPENMTILTVDDTPANIRLLTHYLEKQRYQVITAEDGFEGFKAAIQYHPDLVLLDVMMPDTDGYEVCELLKAEEETKDIPVVFLTAKTEVEDRIKGFELGAADYITKPFNLTEISTRVETQLKLKTLQETNLHYRRVWTELQSLANMGIVGNAVVSSFARLLHEFHKKLENIQKKVETDTPVWKTTSAVFKLVEKAVIMVQKWTELIQHITIDKKKLEIGKFIQDSLNFAEEELLESVSIEFNKPEKPYTVMGDYGLLQQAFATLLTNIARNADNQENILIKLEQCSLPENLRKDLKGTVSDSYVRIDIIKEDIKDKGESLKPEMDIFLDGKKNDTTALGLSAVYIIAKEHDGVLDIKRKNGKDITASIFLPSFGT